MKVWLPYTEGGSGTDVFTRMLADGLRRAGVDAVVQRFPRVFQYAPWLLRFSEPPAGTDIVLANSWNGFAFRRHNIKLVTVEHLFVLDPAMKPYRSFAQSVFHNTLVRYFEKASMSASNVQVAVSEYTAAAHYRVLRGKKPRVIRNGIDTKFFTPPETGREPLAGRQMRLLFVGNLTRRKGVDLIPGILGSLGPGFKLDYAIGLRTEEALEDLPNARSLGRLDKEAVREAYRRADLLLFPTRLEGLPLVAIEAMACGTPVIASNTGPLPEVVKDGESGVLCDLDQHAKFVSAIRRLQKDPGLLLRLGENARRKAENSFSIERMVDDYIMLFEELLG